MEPFVQRVVGTLWRGGVLSRIRWAGVVVGMVATTLLALLLILFVVFPVIFPYLHRTYIAEGAGVTAREDTLYTNLSNSSLLAALLLAALLGGLLAGGAVRSYPGLNGAISAALGTLGIFVWYVEPWDPVLWELLWEPPSNPGEALGRAENLYALLELGVIFCLVLPLVVLAGYLGGELGARLRSRAVPTSAP
jgi:hypothetical protein